MSVSPAIVEEHDVRAVNVLVDAERLTVELDDGRAISALVAWYPLLSRGSRDQRNRWELIGEGEGIHWPELDEDISVEQLLKGIPAPKHWAEEFAAASLVTPRP